VSREPPWLVDQVAARHEVPDDVGYEARTRTGSADDER
jgi:hypothetical protein